MQFNPVKFNHSIMEYDKNYQMTEYPRIFKKSYWGRHLYEEDDIIENRNMFVRDFRVKEYKSYIPWSFDHDLFSIKHSDHKEYYVTENKDIIILISVSEWANFDDHFQQFGFRKYKKLYSHCSTTYFGIIPHNWKNKLSNIKKDIKNYLKENRVSMTNDDGEFQYIPPSQIPIEGMTQQQYILSKLFI